MLIRAASLALATCFALASTATSAEPPGVVCTETPQDAVCGMVESMLLHLATTETVGLEGSFRIAPDGGVPFAVDLDLTGAPAVGVGLADLGVISVEGRADLTLVLGPDGELDLYLPAADAWIAPSAGGDTGVGVALDGLVAGVIGELGAASFSLDYQGERECAIGTCEVIRVHGRHPDATDWEALLEIELESGTRVAVALHALPDAGAFVGLGQGLEAELRFDLSDEPIAILLPAPGEAVSATDAGALIAGEPVLEAILDALSAQPPAA